MQGLRSRLIDLRGVPRDVQRLASLGYAVMVLLVVAVLCYELMPLTPGSVRIQEGSGAVLVPWGALALSSTAFVMGWAFLLTGAGSGPKWAFYPVAVLFFCVCFVLASSAPWSGQAAFLLALCVFSAVCLAMRVILRQPSSAMTRFVRWAGLGGALLVILWSPGSSLGQVGTNLESLLLLLAVLLLPFFILLGVELVDAGVRAGSWLASHLGERLPSGALHLTAVLLLMLPIVSVFAAGPGGNPSPLDVPVNAAVPSVVLLLGAIVVKLTGRWNPRLVRTFIALAIAVLFIGLGASLVIWKELAPAGVSKVALLPPAFLFAATLVYHSCNFGPRLVARESRLFPRDGRVLTYFGVVALLLAYALLRLTARVEATGQPSKELQTIFNSVFFIGSYLLGPFYLAWIAWKHPARLAAQDSPESECGAPVAVHAGANGADRPPNAKPDRWIRFSGALVVFQAVFFVVPQFRPGHLGLVLWTLGAELTPLIAWVTLPIAAVLCLVRRPFFTRARVIGFVLLVVTGLSSFVFASTPYPSSHDRRPSQVRFRLPLDGPITVAWGGGSVATNYHVVAPDQRWAYDLLVTRDGATHRGDGSKLKDYYYYGLPVLAPADGTVHTVVDGHAEMPPGKLGGSPAGGNQLVITVAPGQYLFLCHLQPGSIRVRKGDAVRAGQAVARGGNSGNTSEPHLHVHLQDTPEDGWGEGIPLYFHDYRLAGQIIRRAIPLGGERPQIVEHAGAGRSGKGRLE